MKRKSFTYYFVWIFILLIVSVVNPFAYAQFVEAEPTIDTPDVKETAKEEPLPVKRRNKKPAPTNYEQLKENEIVDLANPDNIKSNFVYDPQTGGYIYSTKVGDMEVGTPFMLTKQEYMDYSLSQSMRSFYRQKVSESVEKGREKFNIADMKFGLGPAEKFFGPGGVQIKTSGSAELIFGVKTNNVKNPSLPEYQRNRSYFDFDEKIQINVNAKVGDKVSFGLNYNTEASFEFDQSLIKLNYQGKEDEIIKKIEAGNVSMQTSNALITGGASLFGIKTELQFGKLSVRALISQQQSESKTVNSKGGVQLTPFELNVDEYDANRHFFIGHYFRDTYGKSMSKAPFISNGITISRVEVWVTNKRANYDQARNIVAFVDMGEHGERIHNNHWQSRPGANLPANASNNLYDEITQQYAAARDFQNAAQVLSPLEGYGVLGGVDYERVESARKLDPSEYVLNTQLGYISLKSELHPDEALAIAYEYKHSGKVYQVGEFAADNSTSNQTLFVKLLKNTAFSPQSPCWSYMMKNVYSLRSYQLQKEKFKLDILYQSDTTGIYLNYINEGRIKKQMLLKVLGLDRLNSRQEPYSDGQFDYLEGYTILAATGKVIFPVVEPFGSDLARAFNDPILSKKYVFQELYDSTVTVARQIADKNKFRIQGEYKASSGSEIQLGAMNVPRGSVKVTAGGATLTENNDYMVDYTMGVVTITNQSILDSGTPVSVSLESQNTFNLQQKTLLGADVSYAFSDRLNVGATVMYLSEKPMTQKVAIGAEPISNTIWGVNLAWNTPVSWLTKAVSWLPGVSATAPSNFSIKADFAHLIPGHPSTIEKQGLAYLDDFESTKSSNDIRYPDLWFLASTPQKAGFAGAEKTNDIAYNYERAHFAWYMIDGLFTRQNSNQTPKHIRGDLEQLSNHYVREIQMKEIFPNRESVYGQTTTVQALNLSFYPAERGMYNLDLNVDLDGKLLNPASRWGGIMRKLDNSDFEASNIEYIQFWMMDPFVYDTTMVNRGGELIFNLGEISEDILKDGKKFFENGLPINDDPNFYAETVWGRVPTKQSLVYAFDNTPGAREKQDVGLNGLNSEQEKGHDTYRRYLEDLKSRVSPETWQRYVDDPFSPVNTPSRDKFHYFRGADYDRAETPILDRYKYYNGTEGNSPSADDAGAAFDMSGTTLPDVEDINQDNTLNEYERYYRYKISLKHEDMKVGTNYIVNKQTSVVKLANERRDSISWYQFKVPIREYNDRIGAISDFKTIRFIRMYMTGFEQETHLRFATMELVRGEWRAYTQRLAEENSNPNPSTLLDLSAVNIEESASKAPVNYVLPPGVSRVIDPGQPQLRQQNEQALSMKITNLAPGDARAVYKNLRFDMRQYKKLQMFVHAEQILDDPNSDLRDGDLKVFIRLGSDYQNNYYEYEIPLKLTPEGRYINDLDKDREQVWPKSNMFDFPFSLLTQLKLKRNKERVSQYTPYAFFDPDKPENKVTVKGNPSIAEVKTIMIGVRNKVGESKSIEVWVNELRLSDFNEQGGWAAQGNASITLSDFATVNLSGRHETAGFGTIEQTVQERRLDDFSQYSVSTAVEVGKILPEKAKVKIPVYFSISEQYSQPQYNPIDQDVLLKDAIDNVETAAQKDSVRNLALDKIKNMSVSVSSAKIDIASKNPMPWDPANFTFNFAYNEISKRNPTTEKELEVRYKGGALYSYTPYLKPVEPFSKMRSKSPWAKFLKEFNFYYAPNNISFSMDMDRYYYELQLRDLANMEQVNDIPMTVSKDFAWNRNFAIRWDLTKTIKLSLTTAHNARVDETLFSAVNRELYPNEYRNWQDTVLHSLSNFGTSMLYNQTFTGSWNVPLNRLPLTDWITLTGQYNATYKWERGSIITADVTMGNTIVSQMNWQVDGRLNFESLYNKSSFLKEANRYFNVARPTPNTKRGTTVVTTPKKPAKKPYETYVQLKSDTTVRVVHRLNNKKFKLVATRPDGSSYPIKYKVLDPNSILVTTQDTSRVFLSIMPPPDPLDNPAYKVGLGFARVAMLIRSISINYRQGNSMLIPSFKNEALLFGQSNAGGLISPGLDFAFGFAGEEYLDRAMDNGWLMVNDSLTSPAVMSYTQELQLRATLEPWPGLKIELNANRTQNSNSEYQFMFASSVPIRTGNFRMTTVALMSAFAGSNKNDGFQSETFNRFRQYREKIASRLERNLEGTRYPSTGFMENSPLRGQLFDPANGTISRNSPDVLIPAFLAAYTGKDVESIGLTPFPSLLSLLPNWKITFDGLTKIGNISKYFKTITLSHGYTCTYNVGGYNSYSQFVASEHTDDFGYIQDVLSGNPLPSSLCNISSVNLTESFNPLFGIDIGMKNNITCRGEYKKMRNLSLNMGAIQLVETASDEIVIGVGYKLIGLSLIKAKQNQKTTKVSNDLTIKGDFSYRQQRSLIRRLESGLTEPTSGNEIYSLKISAEYILSSMINLRLFYDWQSSSPLVSAATYPISNSNVGISVRFALTR